MYRYSAGSLAPSERSRQWCALAGDEHIECAGNRPASIRGGDFGPLHLSLVSRGRHHVVQRRTPEGAAPILTLVFQERGIATVRQGQFMNLIRTGEWCAIRKDIPYEIEAADQSRQLCITLPCELVSSPGRGAEWWRQPRSFLRGTALVLHASASASILSVGSLSRAACEQLGPQLAAMVGMTIRTAEQEPAPDPREQRRKAVLEYIDSRLTDPDLGVRDIAQAFDCSPRSIHKLFEGQPHTVSRVIWERRIDRCRSDMIDPSIRKRSITEVAHHWGFSDSQHFSRAFKARFGISPREYRAMHMAG